VRKTTAARSKAPVSQTATALIVGAGAVENAWKPVIRAIQKFTPVPLTADGTNSFLASLIYHLRVHWTPEQRKRLSDRKMGDHYRQHLSEIRHAISKELQQSQENGELRVRKELWLVLRDRMEIGPFGLVTTNWDTVVDDAISNALGTAFDPSHIHGSIKEPNCLFMPTEVVNEPYRSKKELLQIDRTHMALVKNLQMAHRVLVYGLSLSPLDAELTQLLRGSWDNDNLEQIDVVVPDHEIVAERVNLLLNHRRGIVVQGFHPNSFKLRGRSGKGVNHTIRLKA
jgi:hypothetical protein